MNKIITCSVCLRTGVLQPVINSHQEAADHLMSHCLTDENGTAILADTEEGEKLLAVMNAPTEVTGVGQA